VLVFALAQAAVGTTALLLVGRMIGVQMRPNFPLLVVVILLTILCLCGLGVVVATCARSFSQGSLMTDTLGAGLIFLAPVYYAPEMMPRSLRMFAQILPTTFAARGVQTTLAGGHAIGTELLALSLTAIVTLTVGFRLMQWRED
jgi:ABC-type multidrug transport system permease subunit